MKGVELYGRVRYAVRIEGLSERRRRGCRLGCGCSIGPALRFAEVVPFHTFERTGFLRCFVFCAALLHRKRIGRCPCRYAHLRSRGLRSRAHGAKRHSSNLLQRQAVHCFNDERHPIQDDFHPGRENDPSAQWKEWQKKLGHLEIGRLGLLHEMERRRNQLLHRRPERQE